MRIALFSLLLVGVGCGAPTGHPPHEEDGGVDGGVDAGHRAGPALEACASGVADVDSIAKVVERLNSLPPPVSVACFVAGLRRPLNIVAADSNLSAQPAASAKSPRIFLLQPGIVLSVVPEGAGAKVMEMGQWVTNKRTVKGELEMPVTGPLAPDAPLKHVAQSNDTTTCAICHRAEEPYPGIPGGYASAAFRPNPGQEVKVGALAAEHRACIDLGDTSERCALFHALFDFGQVRQGAFSSAVELFIQ